MSGGNLERVLRLMAERSASDAYISAKTPILIKVNGQMMQLSDQPLTPAQPRQLLAEMLTEAQLAELDSTSELNVAVGVAGVGSFRLSAFKQRGSIAAVFRCIPFHIPPIDTLGVPDVLSQIVLEKRGLVLMVGATGSGKSTTLGQNWSLGLVAYSMGNILLGPNPRYPNCSTHATGTLQSPGVWGLSSLHPGGANILLADGSVRFLKDSVALETVWALGTRAGGEIVSSDAY